VINGQSLMIFGSSDGGVHFQPQTGQEVWKYYASPRGINTTPLIVGNKVFCGHSEENLDENTQGALFALDATKSGDIGKSGQLWRHNQLSIGKNAPIMVDGKLVAVEETGKLVVIDPENGKEIASKKLGTMMTGSPIYADGKIYVCATNGRWFILKLNGNNIDVVHQLRLNNEEVHASPVVSHGRIYLQTMNALYCIGRADQAPSIDPRPEAAKEPCRIRPQAGTGATGSRRVAAQAGAEAAVSGAVVQFKRSVPQDSGRG
jgi:outer membrane protein assembly factor BamB